VLPDIEHKKLIRIIAGASVFSLGMLLASGKSISYVMPVFLAAYIIIGYDVLIKALKNLSRGHALDETFLMSVATICAFLIGEYSESVAVMLFYQIGEFFQGYAVDKSRKSIADLMDIRPDYANVRRGKVIEKTDPYDVSIGDYIIIKPGERIPLDALVTEGVSSVDVSALTGESLPVDVAVGDSLLSGSVNINGFITARVTKEFGESTVSKILELVENAACKKSNAENFITKFARYYTPSVVVVAALIAVIPPLAVSGASFGDWIYRGLIFLVISCPCALVISIPLSFFGGIGGASRNGILFKGANYLEALAKSEIMVFDKTGTLTKGVFKVQDIVAEAIEPEELLEAAAYAENYSNHPISISLKQAYKTEINADRITKTEEVPGYGVEAVVDGKNIAAGNARLMKKIGVAAASTDGISGTVVHVAVNGKYKGYIVIADEIKEDARQAMLDLKKAKIGHLIMLTGDSRQIGEKVALQLGIDQAYTELLPADKVGKVEELFRLKSPKGKLAFVGDGVNDAPVLARADIGIAMGGLGADAAIEAADVVIMTDEPSKIVTALAISRKTISIVKQNIVLALAVKGIVLILGAAGIASMWEAVFADVGVTLLAVMNSIRMLNVKAAA